MLLKASDGTKIRRIYLRGEITRTPSSCLAFCKLPNSDRLNASNKRTCCGIQLSCRSKLWSVIISWKSLAILRICADSYQPSLLTDAISTEISCTGHNLHLQA